MRVRTGLSLLVVALLGGACASVTPHITLPPLVLGEPSFFPTREAHVLLDSFGSLGMPPEYAETLRQAGCRVVVFRPLSPLDIRVNSPS